MEALQQYFLLIFFIFFQTLFIKKLGKKPVLLLISFELWFLSAFRSWEIGNDTRTYVGTFSLINTSYWQVFYQSYMESGYILFNRFVSFFSNNPQAILIASSLVIISSRFLTFSRYSVFAGFTVLLFVISQFGNTLNIIRQELAFSLILFFIPLIIKRKFLPYLLICFLATSIHITAIVALPMYWLYILPWRKKYVISMLLVGCVFFILLGPLLDTFFNIFARYEGYVGTRFLGEEIKIGSIMRCIIAGLILIFEGGTFLCYRKKCTEFTGSPLRVDFLLYMVLFGFMLEFMSIRGTLFNRISLYYTFFSILSLPIFIQLHPRQTRALLYLITVGCFLIQGAMILWFRPEWNYWLPYKFCF